MICLILRLKINLVKSILKILKGANPWRQVEEFITQISLKDRTKILAEFKRDNPENYGTIERLLGTINKFYNFHKFNITETKQKTLPECTTSEELTLAITQTKESEIDEEELLAKYIAIVQRAISLFAPCKPHLPRNTQLIALLDSLLSDNPDTKGHLLQVRTGHGKSVITAMLAAIKTLLGGSVDVVSSSHILAKRDGEDFLEFYKALGLSAGILPEKLMEKQECYANNQIIYGSLEAMQGDYLRHFYQDRKVRGDRPFDTIIVDEVDSMLCDRAFHITKLMMPRPGVDLLLPFLSMIWFQLELLKGTDIAYERKRQFLIDYTHSLAKHHPRAEGDDQIEQMDVPQHLRNFFDKQVPIWVESALKVSSLALDEDYTVSRAGRICPIDYKYTGVVYTNMSWGQGIQQFLQLKHGMPVTPEGFTSCYISMQKYLSLYTGKLYGLTGTLGSAATKEFFKNIYGVSTSIIPTYNESRFKELETQLCDDFGKWRDTVVDEVHKQATAGRPVLVISETITASRALKQALIEKGYDEDKIHSYNRNDSGPGNICNIPAGHVLFATNLAGRGEDYKVVAKYGLHVCITYLPLNLRVEEQAFGRSARNGQAGSGRLFINNARLYNQLYPFVDDLSNIAAIRDTRSLREQQRLIDLQQGKFKYLDVFDKLFDKIKDHVIKERKEATHRSIINQIDELWSFQYTKLSELIDSFNRQGRGKLQQAISKFNLSITPTQLLDNPDSLYSIVSQGLRVFDKESPHTPLSIKKKALTLLLRHANPSEADLHTKYADTRANPTDNTHIKRLMETISQVIGRSIVLIDHRERIRVFKYTSQDPPLEPLLIGCVDLGHIEDHTTQSLCILKSEYGDDYSPEASPTPLDFSFLRSNFYILSPVASTPDLIASHITDASAVSPFTTNTPSIDLKKFISEINEYITKTLTKNYWDKLQANFEKVVKVFIDGVKGLTAGIRELRKDINKLQKLKQRNETQEKTLKTKETQLKTKAVKFLINLGYLCNFAVFNKQALILDELVTKDSFIKFVALYQRAKVYIEKAEEQFCKRSRAGDKAGKKFLEEAEPNLKQALGCSDQLVRHWMPVIFLRHHKFIEVNSPFFQQISAKITFIDYLRQNITAMLEVIEKKDKAVSKAEDKLDSNTYFLKTYKEIYIDDFPNYIHGFTQADLDYFQSIGLEKLYGLTVKRPLPKLWEQIGLGIIGLGQVILGAYIALKGGSYWGTGMIKNGLSDMWAAIQSAADDSPVHSFNTGEFWLRKAIDYGGMLAADGLHRIIGLGPLKGIQPPKVGDTLTLARIAGKSLQSFATSIFTDVMAKNLSDMVISKHGPDIFDPDKPDAPYAPPKDKGKTVGGKVYYIINQRLYKEAFKASKPSKETISPVIEALYVQDLICGLVSKRTLQHITFTKATNQWLKSQRKEKEARQRFCEGILEKTICGQHWGISMFYNTSKAAYYAFNLPKTVDFADQYIAAMKKELPKLLKQLKELLKELLRSRYHDVTFSDPLLSTWIKLIKDDLIINEEQYLTEGGLASTTPGQDLGLRIHEIVTDKSQKLESATTDQRRILAMETHRMCLAGRKYYIGPLKKGSHRFRTLKTLRRIAAEFLTNALLGKLQEQVLTPIMKEALGGLVMLGEWVFNKLTAEKIPEPKMKPKFLEQKAAADPRVTATLKAKGIIPPWEADPKKGHVLLTKWLGGVLEDSPAVDSAKWQSIKSKGLLSARRLGEESAKGSDCIYFTYSRNPTKEPMLYVQIWVDPSKIQINQRIVLSEYQTSDYPKITSALADGKEYGWVGYHLTNIPEFNDIYQQAGMKLADYIAKDIAPA